MWASDDRDPPTTPSLRGGSVRERPVTVEFQEAPSATPASTSVPLIRVARWMQAAAKGTLTMGPGATSTHSALLVAVAQYQGQNEYSTAGQRTLAAFANSVERTARTALAELVDCGWLIRCADVTGEPARYAVAMTPGRPIPDRPPAKNSATPRISLPGQSDTPANDSGGPRQTIPEGSGSNCRGTPDFIADKKTSEETIQKTSEKPIAPASARGVNAQGDLFGSLGVEPVASPPPKRPGKRGPSREAKRPRWRDYADAFRTGCADAGANITPLTEGEAATIGRTAATHAMGLDGKPLTGPDVDAWIRKMATTFARAGGNLTAWNFKNYCDRTLGGARMSPPARAAPIRVQPGGIAAEMDPAWDDESEP